MNQPILKINRIVEIIASMSGEDCTKFVIGFLHSIHYLSLARVHCNIYISVDECNTILSAYTMYRHLE